MQIQKNTIYNIVIMLFCIGLTAFTLSQFAWFIQPVLSRPYSWKFELAMVTGQLFFQHPFIYRENRTLVFSYFQNMLIVSCIGSLLLMPLIIVNYIIPLSIALNLVYFFSVVTFMFFEHRRRVIKLGLPHYLCYTWVCYRLLILPFII